MQNYANRMSAYPPLARTTTVEEKPIEQVFASLRMDTSRDDRLEGIDRRSTAGKEGARVHGWCIG